MSDQRSNDARRPVRPPGDGGGGERPRRDPDRERRIRRSDDGEERRQRPAARQERAERPLDAVGASRIALDAIQTMTNRTAEGVVGVERDGDGGWLIVVELLETARVPATADVLGEYEVEIGPDRALRSYTRRSRYTRASTMSDGATG